VKCASYFLPARYRVSTCS